LRIGRPPRTCEQVAQGEQGGIWRESGSQAPGSPPK